MDKQPPDSPVSRLSQDLMPALGVGTHRVTVTTESDYQVQTVSYRVNIARQNALQLSIDPESLTPDSDTIRGHIGPDARDADITVDFIKV